MKARQALSDKYILINLSLAWPGTDQCFPRGAHGLWCCKRYRRKIDGNGPGRADICLPLHIILETNAAGTSDFVDVPHPLLPPWMQDTGALFKPNARFFHCSSMVRTYRRQKSGEYNVKTLKVIPFTVSRPEKRASVRLSHSWRALGLWTSQSPWVGPRLGLWYHYPHKLKSIFGWWH